MKKILFSVLAMMISININYAQEDDSSMITKATSAMDTISVDLNKGHFYVGGGVSTMDLENTSSGETFSTYAKNIIAGYQHGDYMAVEVRYSSGVGSVEYISGTESVENNDDYPTNFTNAGVYFKGLYPIGDIKIYGLMGYGEVRISNVPEGDPEKTETGIQWGGGISYRVYDKVNIFADYVILYNDVGFDTLAQNSDMSSNIMTVGITYWF